MIGSFENSVRIPIFRNSTSYFTGVGDPEECAKADGISYYNSGTSELRKPLQYRKWNPILSWYSFCCGSMCYVGKFEFGIVSFDLHDGQTNE
jgi:hypothetical protein